jgi:hypothetical protein
MLAKLTTVSSLAEQAERQGQESALAPAKARQ